MTHPPLPPRGIFVPTPILFHPELSATVLVTWLKLRSLAWDGWDTPPMNLSQLAAYLGIHPARLNRHLDQLQEVYALFIRPTSQARIILSFPEEPPFYHEPLTPARNKAQAARINPDHQASADLASYFPARIMGYISYDDEETLIAAVDRAEPAKDQARLTPCAKQEPAFTPR